MHTANRVLKNPLTLKQYYLTYLLPLNHVSVHWYWNQTLAHGLVPRLSDTMQYTYRHSNHTVGSSQ